MTSNDEFENGDLDKLDAILENNFDTTFNHCLSTENGSVTVVFDDGIVAVAGSEDISMPSCRPHQICTCKPSLKSCTLRLNLKLGRPVSMIIWARKNFFWITRTLLFSQFKSPK